VNASSYLPRQWLPVLDNRGKPIFDGRLCTRARTVQCIRIHIRLPSPPAAADYNATSNVSSYIEVDRRRRLNIGAATLDNEKKKKKHVYIILTLLRKHNITRWFELFVTVSGARVHLATIGVTDAESHENSVPKTEERRTGERTYRRVATIIFFRKSKRTSNRDPDHFFALGFGNRLPSAITRLSVQSER
jgi:hypothetical protein